VIHLVEDEDLEITEITRDQVGHDVALAVRKHFVAASEAVHDQMYVGRPVALLDQIGPSFDRPDISDEFIQHPFVGVRQRSEAAELPSQWVRASAPRVHVECPPTAPLIAPSLSQRQRQINLRSSGGIGR
jgi:hypothetical protein